MSIDPPRLPRPIRPSLRIMKPKGQDADPDEGSPYPKCSLFLRAGARALDAAIAWSLYITFGQAGGVVALVFLSLADGLMDGQSVGKRMFGIKVVHLPTRAAAQFRESVLRNAPLSMIVLLGMMPEPLGLVAFAAGSLVIGGVEAWKVVRDPLGIRLGDVWGQTQVVDGKVVIGALAPGVPETAEAEGRVMLSGHRRGVSQKVSGGRLTTTGPRRKQTCALR